MKKLPFLLIVLFHFVWFGNAQAQIVKSIGLRAGFASTFPEMEETRNGVPTHDIIRNLNIIYGEFQTELFPQNHLSLLTNVSYISKGFSYPYFGSGGFGIIGGGGGMKNVNADYFTIALCPKYSWNHQNTIIYGFAGPYISVLSSYAAYYKQGLYFMSDFEEVLVLKPRTWGGTIGGGIEFKRKSKRLYYSVQAQYMEDLTRSVNFTYNHTNKYGTNHDYLFKAKFQTFLLSFGVHYSFKKKE